MCRVRPSALARRRRTHKSRIASRLLLRLSACHPQAQPLHLSGSPAPSHALSASPRTALTSRHNSARRLSSSAAVNYPIRHGIVENWDNMERYWQRCIYKYLRCDPQEHNFLLTEPPMNTPENREVRAAPVASWHCGELALWRAATTSSTPQHLLTSSPPHLPTSPPPTSPPPYREVGPPCCRCSWSAARSLLASTCRKDSSDM